MDRRDAIVTIAAALAATSSHAVSTRAGIDRGALLSGGAPDVGRAAGGQMLAQAAGGSRINLLDALNSSERASVVSGKNSVDITEKIRTLIATAPAGSVIDATALKGTYVATGNLFRDIPRAPITLQTGAVVIRSDFNKFTHTLPSELTWQMDGTELRPFRPINHILSAASPAASMVSTYVQTLGSCAGNAGSVIVRAGTVQGVYPGCAIAILGISPERAVTLQTAAPVSPAASSIRLRPPTKDTVDGSLVYLLLEAEIVQGMVEDGVVTVHKRGALGTRPAPHAGGTTATLMTAFVSTVRAVSGSDIELWDNLPRTFEGATAVVGAINAQIRGRGRIDGEYEREARIQPVGIFQAFSSTLGVACKLDGDLTLAGANHGGLLLFASRDCQIRIQEISACGMPSRNLGATLWCFGSATRNRVAVRRMMDGYLAIAIDDKSSGVPYFSLIGPGLENEISVDQVRSHLQLYEINAGVANRIVVQESETAVATGSVNDTGRQATTPYRASRNYVEISHDVIRHPLRGNSLPGNVIVRNGRRCPEAGRFESC